MTCLRIYKEETMKVELENKDYQEIKTILEQAGIQNEVKICYEDVTAGIFPLLERENSEQVLEKKKSNENNRLALISGGSLDWSVMQEKNLVELFLSRRKSKQKIYYYENDSKSEETYESLFLDSLKAAEYLKKSGLKPGDKAILQIPYKKMFLETFWACIFLGVVPAPMGVLEEYERKTMDTDKLYHIWKLLDRPAVLTTTNIAQQLKTTGSFYEQTFSAISMEGPIKQEALKDEELYSWNENEISLLLFTSGSTGLPKGVGLSQHNILARTLGEVTKYHMDQSEVDCNWMTFTHAAGLIWSHIRDLYLDIPQIQVQSEYILESPLRWLQLMSDYKVTTTWAPNFAFALVQNSLESEKEYNWDLSALRCIFSGGEANISKTLRGFLKKLEPYGLPMNSVIPAFGMTETSSCITYYEEFSYDNSSDLDEFLPVGSPMSGIELRIKDKEGNILREGDIGYVQLHGETVTAGYYNNEQANRDTFTEDGWLITGDLGYIKNGQLVLTGREKDIIIINGLNYYVQDFEAAVDGMPQVNSSYTVATSIRKKDGTESILIFFCPKNEKLLQEENMDELCGLCQSIRREVQEKCKIHPDYVIPISTDESVRTDIGKKQRNYYQKKFNAGAYDMILEKLGEKRTKYYMETVWIQEDLKKRDAVKKVEINRCFLDKMITNVKESDIDAICQMVQEEIHKIIERNDVETVIFPTCYSIAMEGDRKFNLGFGCLWGMFETFNLENSDMKIRLVDFDQINEEALIEEMSADSFETVTVYRKGKRLVPKIRTMLPETTISSCEEIRYQELVMVVGGLGGIGSLVSEYLLEKKRAKLLLIGKSPLEKRRDIFGKLKTISEDIIYVSADVCIYEQLKEAVETAKKKWHLNVSHILNFSGKLCPDEQNEDYFADITKHTMKQESLIAYQELSKIRLIGTYNLERIRKEQDANLWLFYSITSRFGGTSLGAYAASNAWQEQYGRHLADKTGKVNTIGLSMWKQTGMNQDVQASKASSKNRGFFELEQTEGMEYLAGIFTKRLKHPMIGIDRNCEKMRKLSLDTYEKKYWIQVPSEEEKERVLVMLNAELSAWNGKIVCKSNPILFAVHSDQNTILENQIRNIWKEVLKLEQVDRFDNIFDLGGNSLSIYKIAAQLSDELAMPVKPIDLMTYPNPSELASYLISVNSFTQGEKKRERSRERVEARKQLLGVRARKSRAKSN